MNINSLNAGLTQSPDVIPDPAPGNTTVGSGKLSSGTTCQIRLIATQASTQEERTLPAPDNAGISLVLVLYATAGANLRLIAASQINAAGNTTALFTAVKQSLNLISIPVAPAAAASPPAYRWQVVNNDGPSLS
jgi:hypothetical protein